MSLTNLRNKNARIPDFKGQTFTFLSKIINNEKLLISVRRKSYIVS